MYKIVTHCLLRGMDFLNVPKKFIQEDAIVRNSPSRVSADFSGHGCPEIADDEQNIKKISFPCAKIAL